ncbi:MAG: peptidoglycan-binding protein [Minisyncoccia bacterium]
MRKYLISTLLVLGILISPPLVQRVHAAGFTPAQVTAITALLQSFGADKALISSVRASLSGTRTSPRTPAAPPLVSPVTPVSAGSTDSGTTSTVTTSALSSDMDSRIKVLSAILNTNISSDGVTTVRSLSSSDQSRQFQKIHFARERGQLMRQLSKTNPAAFLRNALSAETRARLSADVQGEVEKKVTLTGKVEILQVDDFTDKKNGRVDYFLKSGGSRLSLQVAGTAPTVLSGSLLRVSGYQLGETVVADAGAGGIAVLSQAIPEATGLQRVLAIAVTSVGYPAPISPAALKTYMFSGDFKNYYEENSYGKIWFTGDVTDWISVAPYSYYCYTSPASTIDLETPAIKTYLLQHNINLSQYDRLLFILNNDGGGCSGVGKWEGTFNGVPYRLSQSYIGWPSDSSQFSQPQKLSNFNFVLAHEMGHQLGLMHANSWDCTGYSLDVNCAHREYGNRYDLMGSANGGDHFNAFFKDMLGWLDASSKISVTQSGTYSLAPIEAQTGVRAAIITNPATPSSEPLYVEFRQPVGYDTGLSPLSAGLDLNQVNTTTQQRPFSYLLNANYATTVSSVATQSALMPGGNFVWGTRGLQIGSLVSTPSLATFNVSIVTPQCTRSPISILDQSYPASVAAGTTGQYHFTLTNNDTSGCSPSTIQIVPVINDSNGWGISQTPSGLVTLIPGGSATIQLSIAVPANASPASRTLQMTITDTMNSRSLNVVHPFVVLAMPSILNVSPSSGRPGIAVTLTGTGFNTSASGNLLLISGNGGKLFTAPSGLLGSEGSLTFTFPTKVTSFDQQGVATEVPTPVGVYSIKLIRKSDDGMSNEVTYEVVTAVAPTATLTANGSSSATVNVGDALTWAWSSTHGSNYSSTYSASNCSASSSNTNGNVPWTVNTADGSSSGTVPSSWAGCTIVGNYTVAGDGGTTSVSATVQVNTQAPAAPSASLTFGTQTNAVNVDPLVPSSWAWSSSNGASYAAKTARSGCDDASQNSVSSPWTPWDAGTGGSGTAGQGTNTAVPGALRYGCTITATYTVTNSAGQTATANASVTFKHAPPPTGVSATLDAKSLAAPTNKYFTLSGTATPANSYLTVAVAGAMGSTLVPLSGVWSLPFNFGLRAGSYPVTVRSYTPGASVESGTVLTTGTLIVSASTPVSVPAPTPVPSVSVSASPVSVTLGQSTTITWSSTNASQCILGGDFVAGNGVAQGASGSLIVTPTKASSTYSFRCTDSMQTVQATGSVTVTAVPPGQTASALNAFENATNAGSGETVWGASGLSYDWNRDLQLGSSYMSDVTALQRALALQGVYAGEVTGGFYTQTYLAVKTFQQKYGISATGFVGPDTRAKLNSLY